MSGCRVQGAGNSMRSAFATAKSYRPVNERSELDRWILSELNRTCAAVVERMDAYDNFGACQHITEFVDALSNWYVRRSRDRFWAADKRGSRKARRVLDAVRVPGDDGEARRAVRAVSWRRRCGRIWLGAGTGAGASGATARVQLARKRSSVRLSNRRRGRRSTKRSRPA